MNQCLGVRISPFTNGDWSLKVSRKSDFVVLKLGAFPLFNLKVAPPTCFIYVTDMVEIAAEPLE